MALPDIAGLRFWGTGGGFIHVLLVLRLRPRVSYGPIHRGDPEGRGSPDVSWEAHEVFQGLCQAPDLLDKQGDDSSGPIWGIRGIIHGSQAGLGLVILAALWQGGGFGGNLWGTGSSGRLWCHDLHGFSHVHPIPWYAL